MKQGWKKYSKIREMEDLGRFMIPKELRDGLGIEPGQPMEFFTIDDEFIMIRKFCCAICGQNRVTKTFKGRRICDACICDCKTINASLEESTQGDGHIEKDEDG